ncbi:calcitonin gene-related peptide type 1 receptor-like isoform X2 [Amphiura filiformis]|uniref:calcitonin gene-related peptide type 1 receptor-like isoform X2 n=1 Tax=Amphiura filiformis TaxID=82378 RepID=UPI003B21BA33
METKGFIIAAVFIIELTLIEITSGQDFELPTGFSPPYFDELQTVEQRDALTFEAQACLYRMLTDPYPDEGNYCNITFDGWMCWNYTRAGETEYQNCPSWVVSSDPHNEAHKTCYPNGTWFMHPNTSEVWTNYSACHFAPEQENVYIIYYIGYGSSVVSLIIALFIFFYFKSLGCPRVTIHKNLFVSFILCGIMWIVYFAAVVSNNDTLAEDKTWCRVILVLGQYFNTCNYFWMLSEGLYLHTVIVVAVFSENHRLHQYYIIGWVFPMVPVALYTGFMAAFNEGACWLGETPYEWWVAAFIIFVLGVNLILLLNIVRVLLTKLRTTPNAGASTYTRAVRATLILLPLLGLHYLIMPVRPPEGTLAERFFSYLIAVLLSFQGFFVACIFCFFNGEVMEKIHRSFQKISLAHTSDSYTTSRPRQTKIHRKWFSFGFGRKSSVFTSRYGNMNTTVTEAVSMPGRRSVDIVSPGSPLLNKQHGTMGNGTPGGGAVDVHASSSKLEKVNEKDETYGMNGKDYNANKNTGKDSDSGTNSPLIEHHRDSSKTTEV